MASAGGDPSWQAMVSVRTSIVPPGPCPPLPDTPGTSPAVTAPQVTASIHDFAGSLGDRRAGQATTRPEWEPASENSGPAASPAYAPRGSGGLAAASSSLLSGDAELRDIDTQGMSL